MHERSSKMGKQEEAEVKDKHEGVRQMHRHIKMKKSADYEYEKDKEGIFNRRVNSTSKSNKNFAPNKNSRNKRKLKIPVRKPGKEGFKDIQEKGDEDNKSNSKLRRVRKIKKKVDNDFEYSKPVECHNRNDSVKSGTSASSCKEQMDEEPEGMENKNKQKMVEGMENKNKRKKVKLEQTDAKKKENDVFTCEVCNKMVKWRANFERHRKTHSISQKDRKVHKCSYEGCLKTFKDTSNLKKHVNSVHLDVRNYLCEFCVARFKTSSQLKVHIVCHHTKKENRKHHTCEVCSKTFLRKISLDNHMTLHTPTLETYACSFEGCGKSFRFKENVARHVRNVHKSVKHHQCDICDEKFSRKIYLETHMYKHTGIKLFGCEVCGKFFSQKGNLRTHMQLHNKEGPVFNCHKCFQTFNFKSNLTKHLERHEEGPTHSKKAKGMEDDIDFTEEMYALKKQSRLRNEWRLGRTSTRYERETLENEGQNRNRSKRQKILVSPSVEGAYAKSEKTVVLIVKQMKHSKKDENSKEQLIQTTVRAVENNEDESDDVTQNSTGGNINTNQYTAAKGKGNANRCKVVHDNERVDQSLEAPLGNISESSLEENSEIRLDRANLNHQEKSDLEASGKIKGDALLSKTESKKESVGAGDQNTVIASVCIENMTENDMSNAQTITEENNEKRCLTKEADLNETESYMYQIIETSDNTLSDRFSLFESRDEGTGTGNGLALQSSETTLHQRTDDELIEGGTGECHGESQLQGKKHISLSEKQKHALLSDDNQNASTSSQIISVPKSDFQQMLEQVKRESALEVKIDVDTENLEDSLSDAESVSDEMLAKIFSVQSSEVMKM